MIASEWINVKDVLPDPEGEGASVEVLVYAPTVDDHKFIGTARYYYRRRTWCDPTTCSPISGVTHWRPLTELSYRMPPA